MLIAIVGRPNVGKSALFNRIVGKRIAIVHDQPGVTRDRVMAEAEWKGHPFTLVDTGGIGLVRGEKAADIITEAALQQVDLAIEASQVIIFVVNVQEGIVALDQDVAMKLRRAGKPVLLAVNKVDSYRAEGAVDEFLALGFDRIFPVTAIHGMGMENLMDAALALLPPEELKPTSLEVNELPEGSDQDEIPADERPAKPMDGPMKIAIVGRPNVGKSSIINALVKSDRVIVSPIPGTTRDSVDVPFEVVTEGVHQQYILIDTAGVRQERRIDNSIEFYSVKRTEDSIERADLVIFVIDAVEGVTGQDKKVAGKILEARKACILVINKWDLVEYDVTEIKKDAAKERATKKAYERVKKPSTLGEFGNWVQEQMFFLDFAPVIFTSAKSGFHLDRLLEAVRYVSAQLKQKIPTSLLNRTLNDAIEQKQPVSVAGHRVKFFYATQVRQSPPTFLLFVNRDELFSDQYNKYLTGKLRQAFGFEGCPLILVPKSRNKTIAPKRKFLVPGVRKNQENALKNRHSRDRSEKKKRFKGAKPQPRPKG